MKNFFNKNKLLLTLAVYSTVLFHPASAASLNINETGQLSIRSNDGQPVSTLASGSVSEAVQADNQAFKVSFGKDLNGNSTLIVYPNPENPQSLDLTIYGKPVQMTQDAVLTVTGGVNSPQATFQSGVLGTITIDGNDLPAGGTYALNGAPVVSAPTTPTPTVTTPSRTPKPTSSASAPSYNTNEELFEAPANPSPTPSSSSASSPSSGNSQSEGQNMRGLAPAGDRFGISSNRQRVNSLDGNQVPTGGGDSFKLGGGTAQTGSNGQPVQGLLVREVEGDVMYSTSGADPMEMLRNGVQAPRLKPGDVIPAGAQIRTGPNSKVIATPFPGVAIQIQQNSSFGVPVSSLIQQNGNQKRQFEGYLTKGGVLSAIKGIPPQDIDFKIRTPQGVAAARGTVYGVYTMGNRTLVVSEEGTITVFNPDGSTATINVEAGEKAIITRNENGEYTQEIFDADSEELALLENFLNEVQKYLDDVTSGLPPGFYVVDLPGNPFDDLVDALDPVLDPDSITPTLPNQQYNP